MGLTREQITRDLARLLKALGLSKNKALGIVTLLKTDEMRKEMVKRIVEECPQTVDEIMEMLMQINGYRNE